MDEDERELRHERQRQTQATGNTEQYHLAEWFDSGSNGSGGKGERRKRAWGMIYEKDDTTFYIRSSARKRKHRPTDRSTNIPNTDRGPYTNPCFVQKCAITTSKMYEAGLGLEYAMPGAKRRDETRDKWMDGEGLIFTAKEERVQEGMRARVKEGKIQGSGEAPLGGEWQEGETGGEAEVVSLGSVPFRSVLVSPERSNKGAGGLGSKKGKPSVHTRGSYHWVYFLLVGLSVALNRARHLGSGSWSAVQPGDARLGVFFLFSFQHVLFI